MQSTIEPDLLRTFVAIADTGSFTDAAKQVNRTQSAVSMQIKRLEESLGRPVFSRDGRAIALTHEGEVLLGHARRILKAHSDALAAFVQPELQGAVTVGTPDEYAATFLPEILARFAESQAGVQVDVVCETSLGLLGMLSENSVDLALITLGHGDAPGTVLMQEPLVWAASAHHAVEEEASLPLALFHPGCKFRDWALAGLSEQGRDHRIAYTSLSFAGIEAAVRAGLAVTVLPRSNAMNGLRILDPSDGFPELPDYQIALCRAPEANSPIHDSLAEHIVAYFRNRAPI